MRTATSSALLLVALLAPTSVAAQVAPARAASRAQFTGAQSRLIDFDRDAAGASIADRAPLRDRYAAWGVRFGEDDRATATEGVLVSGLNRALPGPDGVLDVVFANGVYAVGAQGFDVVLEAFDARGALLFRARHTDGTAGLFGGASELGWVGVVSERPIFRARFSRAFPEQNAYGFNIDDLRVMLGP